MKVAVLSGKGGAGKTFIAVNLAATIKDAVYLDCDVEEPNGRLFFKPEHLQKEEVYTLLPYFEEDGCTGCRKCVDFCHFHALAFIKNKPRLFPEVCHSCGGCRLVCPCDAVKDQQHPVGIVEEGVSDRVRVVTGLLNIGEASAVPVIKEVLNRGRDADTVIVDCPPGSACSVMESVSECDYCILTAEPTAFGLHNLQMVYELVTLLQKPCGIVINKETEPYEELEQFCKEHQVPILMRIPYEKELSRLLADGKIAVLEQEDKREIFGRMWNRICEEVVHR